MAKKQRPADDDRRHEQPREPRRIDLDDVLAGQPEPIRAELEAFQTHEKKILSALKKDPALHERFLHEPSAVLADLKVPVSAPLRRRLAAATAADREHRARTYVMPDGRTFTPKVNIRIVAGR